MADLSATMVRIPAGVLIVDADVQAIAQAVTDLGTAATAIEAEIAALKNANLALDLTDLDSAVASLKTSVSTIAAIPAA